jgi:RHS repeat-associated protein
MGVLVIALLVPVASTAGVERSVYDIKGGSVVANATFTHYDSRWHYMTMYPNDWSGEYENYVVTNRVILGYDRSDLDYLSSTYSNALSIRIAWTEEDQSTVHVDTVSLSVDYNPASGTMYKDLDVYEFTGGHKVEVKVLSVSGSNPGNLWLRSEIDVERYYEFDETVTPDPPVSVLETTGCKQLQLSWPEMRGAEEYELEFVFINDYDTVGSYLSSSALSYDFRFNTTRIVTPFNFYKLTPAYEHGYLLYRVRGVGRHGSDWSLRKPGKWSSAESGTVNNHADKYAITSPYEGDSLNWSYQAVYVEGGKKSESVGFADGLMMGRQSSGVSNAHQTAIVQEVYYDHFGRAGVSTLPTPVDGCRLKYREDFNLNGDEEPYGKADFALDADTCAPNPGAMDTEHGSGLYYSEHNPDQEGYNAWIAESDSFPFVQVEYMADGTGRIRRQSGAGKDFKLGSGHDVLFDYGTPAQVKLNRLFGTESGYASKYQRNVVTDGNGQRYVTYIDMHGRVVASSLAGATPDSLLTLDSNTGAQRDTALILSNVVGQEYDAVNGVLSYGKTITTDYAGTYLFTYNMLPGDYQDTCLLNDVCMDCVYDLGLYVTELECGDTLFVFEDTINGAAIDSLCNGAGSYSVLTDTFSVNLEIGTYVVSKVLAVNQAALAYYTDKFIESNGCLLSYSDFYNALLDSVDLSGCNVDPCEWDCIQELGTRAEYIAMHGGGSGPEYDSLMHHCRVSCVYGDPCQGYRSAMLAQVSPGGQYGAYTNTSGTYTSTDPVSVFNTSNSFPGADYDWRNPATPYLNPDGSTSMLVNSVGDSVAPEDNTISLTEFIDQWQDSWSESLLPYHPEYCYLAFCEDNEASHQYDLYMMLTGTLDAAIDSGFINPVNMTTTQGLPDTAWTNSGNIDPFFDTGGDGNSKLSAFKYKLAHYTVLDTVVVNIWELAWLTIHCGDTTESEVLDCLNSYDFGADGCISDEEWAVFRDLYYAAKLEYFYKAMTDSAIAGRCYNGCIGSSTGFNTPDPDFECFPLEAGGCGTLFYEGDEDTDQPCYNGTAGYYALKQPVFMGPVGDLSLLGIDDALDSVSTYQDAMCDSTCLQYAEDWVAALVDCAAMDTISGPWLQALEDELAELCMLGCDSLHPGGSSTLPSPLTTANGNATFEEVLAYYLGVNYETAICNHYLLNYPLPYNQQSIYTGTATLDTCACDKILLTDSLYNSAPYQWGAISVDVLFANTYGIPLSGVSQLACVCNEAFELDMAGSWTSVATWGEDAVNFLDTAGYSAPAAITCTSCAPCDKISDLRDYFEGEYGGPGLSNYTQLLANFLNDTLGYSLSGIQYLSFLEDCDTIVGGDTVCYTTGALPEFFDLMQHLASIGKVGVKWPQHIDLDTVTAFGDSLDYYTSTASTSSNDYYWTCDLADGCDATHFVAHFGDPDLHCDVELDISTGTGKWNMLLSVDAIYPSLHANYCGNAYDFYLLATFRDGSGFTQDTIWGHTDCFPTQVCHCDTNTLYLCNEPYLPLPDTASCVESLLSQVENDAWMLYNAYLDSTITAFQQSYIDSCLDTTVIQETLEMIYWDYEYHYTLYYYDQAGNLVKTVPPKGIDDSFNGTAVDALRPAGGTSVPAHTYASNYRYNSFNQVIEQASPDGDTTRYWYDELGRLVASQDGRQRQLDEYSYLLFDEIGRIKEAGQTETNTAINDATALDSTAFMTWLLGGDRTEITRTIYDTSATAYVASRFHNGQTFLRMRISTLAYYDDDSQHDTAWTNATHYSYDVHGNVKEVLQDVPELTHLAQDIHRTEYDYELVSGNVKEVIYQKDSTDQFRHKYHYDEDNRLKEVYTSKEGSIWDRDAKYFYYKHGPLARVERGEYMVQGEDYAYTINGWIKGYNSATFDTTRDMGKDGGINYHSTWDSLHRLVARDSLGWILGYYNGDYTAVSNPSSGVNFEATYAGTTFGNWGGDLYNGNIRHVVTAIGGMDIHGNQYNYDQLQRIKKANVFTGVNTSTNTWSGASLNIDYACTYDYDANGNITNLTRQGNGSAMDNLTYNYISGKNRLDYVDDGVGSGAYSIDIDDQASGNYEYWDNGALLADAHDEIDSIYWTVDRKVKKIVRTSGSNLPDLEFIYDAFGRRLAKIEKPRLSGSPGSATKWEYTYYMYDAGGNAMALYDYTVFKKDELKLLEQNIYGAGRLGLIQRDKIIATYSPITETLTLAAFDDTSRTLGKKVYEFSGHTNNVHLTTTDRTIAVDDGTGEIYTYLPDVNSTADFYPGGMLMPGRSGNSDSYRYGLQGKEKDNEWAGDGNSVDFGARMYDPRLGRWRSMDAYASKYPELSPYCFVANSPLMYLDPDGNDIKPTHAKAADAFGALIVQLSNNADIDFNKRLEAFGIVRTPVNYREDGKDLKTYVYTSNDQSQYTLKQFQKRAKQHGVKLKGQDLSDAYEVYQAVQSDKVIEVDVWDGGSGRSSFGEGKGTPGSKIVKELDGYSRNILSTGLSNALEEANDARFSESAINKALQKADNRGTDWGYFIGEHDKIPLNVGGEIHHGKGTIVIEGTGKTDEQNARPLLDAIKSNK